MKNDAALAATLATTGGGHDSPPRRLAGGVIRKAATISLVNWGAYGPDGRAMHRAHGYPAIRPMA